MSRLPDVRPAAGPGGPVTLRRRTARRLRTACGASGPALGQRVVAPAEIGERPAVGHCGRPAASTRPMTSVWSPGPYALLRMALDGGERAVHQGRVRGLAAGVREFPEEEPVAEPPFIAKRPAVWRWLSVSREAAHRGCRSSSSSMRDPSRTLTMTSGGSSDTDMKAVAVMPDVRALGAVVGVVAPPPAPHLPPAAPWPHGTRPRSPHQHGASGLLPWARARLLLHCVGHVKNANRCSCAVHIGPWDQDQGLRTVRTRATGMWPRACPTRGGPANVRWRRL